MQGRHSQFLQHRREKNDRCLARLLQLSPKRATLTSTDSTDRFVQQLQRQPARKQSCEMVADLESCALSSVESEQIEQRTSVGCHDNNPGVVAES